MQQARPTATHLALARDAEELGNGLDGGGGVLVHFLVLQKQVCCGVALALGVPV